MASGVSKRRNERKRGPDGGRFARECCCINHDNYSEGQTFTWVKTVGCKSRKCFQKLVENGLVTLGKGKSKKLPTWICTSCLNYSQTHFVDGNKMRRHAERHAQFADASDVKMSDGDNENEDAPVTISQTADQNNGEKSVLISLREIRESFVQISHAKSFEDYSVEEKSALADISNIIGDLIKKDIYREGQRNIATYKDLTTDIESNDWLHHQNQVLVAFLKGCCKLDNSSGDKKLNALVHSVEQVLYTRNLNVITPISFRRNVVQYSISGSKMSTQINGSWEPAGGYTTVRTFIDAPCDPPECPEGDVENAIDNEQRVAKTSGPIQEDSKLAVDICTTVSHLLPKPISNLQKRDDLKPSEWQMRSDDPEIRKQLIFKVNDFESTHMNIFRSYRELYLTDIIERVKNEQKLVPNCLDRVQDYVDISIRDRSAGRQNKVCSNCNAVYAENINGSPCPSCNFNSYQYPSLYDAYARTESKLSKIPSSINIGEPCMVNPNTETNVCKVLKHVQRHCNLGVARKWTTVWSDAVPYIFGCNLQDNLHICISCQEEVDTRKVTLEEHVLLCPENTDGAQFKKVFGDILFRPGPGHIELNMARCVLKFAWAPFFSHIAKMLGFRTQRAQEVIKNGVDHHRSMQIIRLVMHALAMELVVPYIRMHQNNGTLLECNAKNYIAWVNQVTDPTYIFLWHACFAFLLAVNLYNEASRKNNSQNMMAARAAFVPLFFVRRHRMYQELHLRDVLERVTYPLPLSAQIQERETFSDSGRANAGQGADFLHEQTNRTIKSFLPPGRVTPETWIKICRKADDLLEMKESCLQKSGVNYSPSIPKPPKRHEHEITMARREFRTKELTTKPFAERPMLGLSNEELDPELPNFRDTLEGSYNQYKDNFTEKGSFGGVKMKSLFITVAERQKAEKLENKTKAEIRTEIEDMIKLFNDNGAIEFYKEQLITLKASDVKTKYMTLHIDISRALEEDTASMQLPHNIPEDETN